jgi:hypothetical protein
MRGRERERRRGVGGERGKKCISWRRTYFTSYKTKINFDFMPLIKWAKECNG